MLPFQGNNCCAGTLTVLRYGLNFASSGPGVSQLVNLWLRSQCDFFYLFLRQVFLILLCYGISNLKFVPLYIYIYIYIYIYVLICISF